jgi:hypothetical protein
MKQMRAGGNENRQADHSSEWIGQPDLVDSYFRGIAFIANAFDTLTRWSASGGRCQWVLDAILQIVEWPCQPLRFESVVLRTSARRTFSSML